MAGLVVLALSGIFYAHSSNKDNTDGFAKKIATQIEYSHQRFHSTWEDDTLMALLRAGIFRQDVLDLLRQRKTIGIVEEKGDLKYWTSLALDRDVMPYFDSLGTGIAEIRRGVHYYEVKELGDQRVMLLYPIYRMYQVSKNPLLQEGFNRELGISCKADFSTQPLQSSIRISSELISTPLYIQFKQTSSTQANWLIWLLFSISLICLIVFLVNLFDHLEATHTYAYAWVATSGIVFFIRLISLVFDYPFFLYKSEFFNSEVYTGNYLIPSFGDLLLDTILLFLVLFSAYKGFISVSRGVTKFDWKRLDKKWIQGSLIVVSFLFTLLILGLLQSLIQDSRLNFDVTNILRSGVYTILGLGIAAMLLTAHFLLINMLVVTVSRLKTSNIKLFSYLILSLLVLVPIAYLTGTFDMVLWIQSLSYFVAVFITYQLVQNQNYFQQSLTVLFIVSIFASSLFYRSMHDKEREQRKELADQVSSPKDTRAESVFLQVETQLEKDRFIKDYFKNSLLLKSQLEKRIKQLYFTGYLSRYDIDLYDFDSIGAHYKELNDYAFPYLEDVYNNRTQSTLSNHFYFINDPTLRYGYIARYEIHNQGNRLGYLFIVLKPKFVQDEKIFTELLSQPDERDKPDISKYSYGIYQNNYLISQSGSFPYSLNYNLNPKKEGFTTSEGYSHFLSSKEGNLVVVVSKPKDSLLVPLSVFSFLFLSFLFFTGSVFILNIGFTYLRLALARFGGKRKQLASFSSWFRRFLPYRNYKGLFFSTRIQLVTIGLVLMAMVLTGYFTFEYIRFKYAERQSERLDIKVKSVLGAIENENRFDQLMQYPDQLSAYLNQLAEFYNTDINLYDVNGNLKASTQMRIFQNGLLLNKIHPRAFAKIETESRSQHMQEERIGNLFFLASYVPIFDSQHQLLGYMNIPFFSNEKDLEQELSSFLESFINIYVFLFILAGIIAYVISQRITRPLTFIQRRLSETRLGSNNERLEWRRNDEIGQLVRQYNFMLSQLEQSAQLLAQSEREDAWKEMAKQIAHEIKNPLTPMKLSVQHLQRAWADKKENIDETFKRVTSVLIEQIDSLSLLATEFSSFAKMPEAKVEEFELTNAINSVVELYFNTENMTIIFSAGSEKMMISADKDQLGRVFNNVIKNAIQSIPEDREGQIRVGVQKVGTFAEVRIQDNGNGVPEEIINKIFTPSFSTKNSGMGLGLAISKQIIEQAGGQISFTTKQFVGTEFLIKIPLLA